MNYEKILLDLQERTQFDYKKMNYTDKLEIIIVCRDIIAMMNNYYNTQYDALKSWADLDIAKVRLSETRCDYKKLNAIKSALKNINNKI